MSARPPGLGWSDLPRAAQLYVAAACVGGVSVVVTSLPFNWPSPVLFAALLAASCLASSWKVNLPIPMTSGATLSVSHAADLAALLLLGPGPAVLVAIGGVWTQCTFNVKQPYPLYRTAFSMAAVAMSLWVTGLVYQALGGTLAPRDFIGTAGPLLGAFVTYFIFNSGFVACAIAISTRQSAWSVWYREFFWSATSYLVAGTAGSIAAVIIARGGQWQALLMIAPVYLIYRNYQTIMGRLEDQRRHLEETRRLHTETKTALAQARTAELALTAEKERLAVTLGSIADGVIATDPNGIIVLINPVAEMMTGWRSADALGSPLSVVFKSVDPDTRLQSDTSVQALTAASGPVRRCTLLVASDLTERPIEASAAALRDGHGQTVGMVLVFRDITNALRILEERAKANKLSALGLLAGGIGHDFNNILMTIMGNVSMARTELPETGPVALALDEAEQACLRARQLTWQLLTFSKGGIPSRKTVKLARVLTESVDIALRGTNLRYTLDIDPGLWTIDADETQLVQVLTNLLLNAQEAMPNGGTVAIQAENAVESESRSEHALRVEPGRYVRVSITDTGIGIPPQNLSRIFDPYFSTKHRGSGLGLATTYSIVKNHGGFVAVESQPGRGTTMRINMPATVVEHAVVEPVLTPAATRRRRRILVMDDEASVRTLAVNMLNFLGFQAEVVESGRVAIERFERALRKGRPFDAVMLDLVVPGGMGGKETMDQISRLAPEVKAVLVSGYAQETVVEEYREHGFGAVITKPFTLEELNTTLRSILARDASLVH
jgi:PAS domain S-box-containing protein